MSTNLHTKFRLISFVCVLSTVILRAGPVRGSDHGDTPFLINEQRNDARLTDLYAFVREDNLVLIVCLDPAIPPEVTEYVFASDLTIDVFIDNDSEVTFGDPDDLATFGGTIVMPQSINGDIVFEVRFDEQGSPILDTTGLPETARQRVTLFTGLRDDPFIRGPRLGRNVAAIVLEIPVQDVVDGQDTLLIWATSLVENLEEPFQDLVGRALRSQFPENDMMNTLHPRDHFMTLDVAPDVLIFDPSRPVAFPNGRELTDDVVDLVGDDRVLGNDDPFPDENDLPFLNAFPYLALPHPPEVTTVPTPSMCGALCGTGMVMTVLFCSGGLIFLGRRRAAD